MELHANAFLSCALSARWLCDSNTPQTAPREFLACATALRVSACPPPPLGHLKCPPANPSKLIYIPVHICESHGHVLGFAKGPVLPQRNNFLTQPICSRFVIDGGRRAAMIFTHHRDGTVVVAVDTYDDAGDAVSDVRYFASCSNVFPDCLLACAKMLHKKDCFDCMNKRTICLCNNRKRLDNIMLRKSKKSFLRHHNVLHGGRVTIDRQPRPWRQTFDSYVLSRVGSYVVQVQHTPVANDNTVPPYSIAYKAVYRLMSDQDTANLLSTVLQNGVKPNVVARTRFLGMCTTSVNSKNSVCQQHDAVCVNDEEYSKFECLVKTPCVQLREKMRLDTKCVDGNGKGAQWCVEACVTSEQCNVGPANRFGQTMSCGGDNGVECENVHENFGVENEGVRTTDGLDSLPVVGMKRKSRDSDFGENSKKLKCGDNTNDASVGRQKEKCKRVVEPTSCCPKITLENGRDSEQRDNNNTENMRNLKKCAEQATSSCVERKKQESYPRVDKLQQNDTTTCDERITTSIAKCSANSNPTDRQNGKTRNSGDDKGKVGCCSTVFEDKVVTTMLDVGNDQTCDVDDSDKWFNLKKCVEQATFGSNCGPNSTPAKGQVCCPVKTKCDPKVSTELCKRPRPRSSSNGTRRRGAHETKSDDTTKDSCQLSHWSDSGTESFCSDEAANECCPKVPVVEPDEWDLPSRVVRPATPSDVVYSGNTYENAPPSPCMCTPKDGPDIADSITGDIQIGEDDTIRETNRAGVLKWLTREAPIRLLPPIATASTNAAKRGSVSTPRVTVRQYCE